MDKEKLRQILKKIYRQYRDTGKVAMRAAEIFGEEGVSSRAAPILDGAERNGLLKFKDQELICITEKGIKYMNEVVDYYANVLLGKVEGKSRMSNRFKEGRAFDKIDEKITKQDAKSRIIINVSDNIFHSGKGDVNQEKVRRDKITNEPNKKSHIFEYVVGFFTMIGVIWGIYTYLHPNKITASSLEQGTTQVFENKIATTTLNIADLFSKALSYNTVAERQEFLGKYVGDQIYGYGVINQITIAGDKLLFDIALEKSLIVCPLSKTNELEKQYPLLMGKKVIFYGRFTYETIWGHGDNIISVAPCTLKEY